MDYPDHSGYRGPGCVHPQSNEAPQVISFLVGQSNPVSIPVLAGFFCALIHTVDRIADTMQSVVLGTLFYFVNYSVNAQTPRYLLTKPIVSTACVDDIKRPLTCGYFRQRGVLSFRQRPIYTETQRVLVSLRGGGVRGVPKALTK